MKKAFAEQKGRGKNKRSTNEENVTVEKGINKKEGEAVPSESEREENTVSANALFDCNGNNVEAF